LAIVRAAQRNLLGALTLARRAVQVAPRSASSRSLLGQLLVVNREYQQGLMELNRALVENPRLASAYEARAIAHQALGHMSQARLDAQLAKQFALGNPDGFIDDISFLNQ
jgi:predicted Zn-dependent protease